MNSFGIFDFSYECGNNNLSINRSQTKEKKNLELTYIVFGSKQEHHMIGHVENNDTTKELGKFHCPPVQLRYV
jgi:hypothetical protein